MRACLFGLAALLVACHQGPSKLDQLTPSQAASGSSDPWASALDRTAKHDGSNDNDDDSGKFDFAQMFARVADTLKKPGPYEDPEQSADFDATKPHWGVLKIGGNIVERESFSIFGGTGTELSRLNERMRELAQDDELSGVLLRVDSLDISLPDVAELIHGIQELHGKGKKVYCHVEEATNSTYLVLTACDRIALAPLGEIAITGPAAMPVHLKPLLDKLDIQADFLHVGAYKGAAEPLTRDAPSKEMLETLNAILDQRYKTVVDTIAEYRHIGADDVKAMIDTGIFPADQAKAARLVDEVTPFEAFRASLKQPWTKLELEEEEKSQVATMMKFARFLGAMPPERPVGPHVAVVYALGNIVDGGNGGVLGAREVIASNTLVAALRAIGADDSVKSVVLRVDSGGGSAQASELIWHQVHELREKKPVIVSMSDVAASGGYYISSGATKIYAEPDTLTGSIGVVGGKLALSGALSKIGVNTFPMGRGKHATMMTSLAPWSPDDRATMQAMMETVYKVFVSRVAEGRKLSVAQVDAIAQGRVWTGAKAKELGLVDELGGLASAVAEARKLGNVDANADLEIYPPSPTLRDVLQSFGGDDQASVAMHAQLHALAGGIDPQLVGALDQMLDIVRSFGVEHVQTIAILPVLR